VADFQKPEVVITQSQIEMSLKFGVQTDFDSPKGVPSLKPKLKVDIQFYGCHLEKWI